MRLYISCDSELLKGISLLTDDLEISLSDREKADLLITATKTDENVLSVTLCQKEATIRYGEPARFFRGLAILTDWATAQE